MESRGGGPEGRASIRIDFFRFLNANSLLYIYYFEDLVMIPVPFRIIFHISPIQNRILCPKLLANGRPSAEDLQSEVLKRFIFFARQ